MAERHIRVGDTNLAPLVYGRGYITTFLKAKLHSSILLDYFEAQFTLRSNLRIQCNWFRNGHVTLISY